MKKSKLMLGILKNRHNANYDKVLIGVYQAEQDLIYLRGLSNDNDDYVKTIPTPQGYKEVPAKGRSLEIVRIEQHIVKAKAWLEKFPRKTI